MLIRYFAKFNTVPEHIAFGFAAYILFMRSKEESGCFHGAFKGQTYKIDDEHALYFSKLWSDAKSPGEVVDKALSNVLLWDTDLSILPGFAESVNGHLQSIEETGVKEAMARIKSKKIQFNETE